MRRPKPLSDQDRATWGAYVHDVKRLAGRPAAEIPAPAPAPVADPLPTAPAPRRLPEARARPGLSPLVTGAAPAGLDKGSWNRFSAGKLAPARTLDLHGKTANAAYHALGRFLHAAQAENLRCVEIITGRGSGEAGGVIRRELPLWLNLPGLRPMILATTHPHAANPGAVRVLLKRRRL
jgi:DNA-nicking Smr family endonuclease